MQSLTAYQIAQIKVHIAQVENRLIEDVSDAEVFEYIEDICTAEELRRIATMGSNNPDDWKVKKIRTRSTVVSDLVDSGYEYTVAQ